MTLEQVENLLSKGFTHDEIMALEKPAEPVPAPVPVPEPAPAPAPAPVPVPAPAPVPVPVPEPKTDPVPDNNVNLAQQLGEMSKGITALVQLVQNGNILSSRAPAPEPLTGENALAQILNPFTNEPIGGK